MTPSTSHHLTKTLRGFKARVAKPWERFVSLVEDLVSDENRDKPAKQIELILESGYQDHLNATYENADARLEDLQGLAMYAGKYETTEDFLSELALISTERFQEPQGIAGEDVVMGGEEDEYLTLTSVHQAKGLEWKAVFVIWTAEGKFPSPRSLRETDSEEEERRLWYVALTRAKDELYLTYPLMMIDYQRHAVLQKPSRFVTECPPALFEIWNLEEEVPEWDDPVEIEEKKKELDDNKKEGRPGSHRKKKKKPKTPEQQLAELKKKRKAYDVTTVMVMSDDKPRKTFVMERGAYDKPTKEEVTAGVLEQILPAAQEAPGNRLGLAQWIVDPKNPLTSRVAVNRLWQMIFGMGIVKTAEDFGSQGQRPSHPRLRLSGTSGSAGT